MPSENSAALSRRYQEMGITCWSFLRPPERAKATAPRMAIRMSTEVTSKGSNSSRKSTVLRSAVEVMPSLSVTTPRPCALRITVARTPQNDHHGGEADDPRRAAAQRTVFTPCIEQHDHKGEQHHDGAGIGRLPARRPETPRRAAGRGTASEVITTISERALLMGWLWSRRLIAPARQNPAKTINRMRCIVPSRTGSGLIQKKQPD